MIQYSVGMSLGPSSSVESGVAVREIATGKLIYVDKLFSMSDVQLFFDNYSSIQNSVFCISLPWDNTMMEGKWRVLSKPYQLIHENEDRFLNRDNWMQRFAPRGSELFMKLKEEGADQLLTNCQQLKMKSPKDGKRYNTDVADTEQLLRIVQSIPSPKAEPFRAWLAQVGRERIEETIDPELTIDRALETYLKKGYTREWINQRLQAIQVRKELTDEWDARGVQKGVEYAILTDEISRAWSGMSTRQYKNLKGLKKENLRDNMTTLELVLNMLAEATTTQFSKDRKPTTFQENLEVAKAGGQVAGRTRKDIESQSNTPVISPKNAAQLNQVVTDLLEGAAADMSEMPEKK